MATGSTFMDKGKAVTTGLLKNQTTYIAWGTGGAGGGANPPVSSLTALTAEAASNPAGRQVTTNTQQTPGAITNNTVQYVGTLTAAGTVTINEAGVFDALTNGNPIVIGNFAGISLSSGDSITFTVQLTFS